MAATDARPVPRKNAAFRFYFAIRKNDGTLITTWAGQDSEVSKDGFESDGSTPGFSDCTNEATEIGTTGCGYVDFTAAEMNADCVVYKLTVTNTDALPLVFTFFPEELGDYRADVVMLSGDSSAADNAESFFDGTGYAGTNNVIPTVTTAVNLTNAPTAGDLTATMKNSVTAAVPSAAQNAVAVEAAILNEGDATALLAAIAAKVEEFLINEGDATATITAIAAACNAAVAAGTVGTNAATAATQATTAATQATAAAGTASTINTKIGTPAVSVSADTAAVKTVVDDIPTNAELATALAAADDAVLAAIAALNNLSAAQVNAEVLDVLTTDTFAELAAVPAATSSLKDKLTYIFMWMRNRSTQNSSTRTLFADNGSTIVATEAVGDDGTTYTKGEGA